MKIKFLSEISINNENLRGKFGNNITQLVNSKVKRSMRALGYKEIGKNSKFFNVTNQTQLANLQIYKGFNTSAYVSEESLKLIVDFATRIIRNQTVWEYI